MKTIITTSRVLALVVAGGLAAAPLAAQTNPPRERPSANQQSPASGEVTLRRAQDLMGRDVVSRDGQQLGELADFVFDFSGQPRLTHVIVESDGGQRAVPVRALSHREDSIQVGLGAAEFRQTAVISGDREAFFKDRQRLQALDRAYSSATRPTAASAAIGTQRTGGDRFDTATASPNATATPPRQYADTTGATRPSPAPETTRPASMEPSRETIGTTGTSTSASNAARSTTRTTTTANVDRPTNTNTARAPRDLERGIVFFSELSREDVLGRDGERLGSVTDAWVSLEDGRVPFVELRPDRGSWGVGTSVGIGPGTTVTGREIRYGIPASTYQGSDNIDGHRFAVTAAELRDANSAQESDLLSTHMRDGDRILKLDTDAARGGRAAE